MPRPAAVVGEQPYPDRARQAAAAPRSASMRAIRLRKRRALLRGGRLERIPEGSLQRDRRAMAGDGERALDRPAHPDSARVRQGCRCAHRQASRPRVRALSPRARPRAPRAARRRGAALRASLLGRVLGALALRDAEPHALLVGPALALGLLLLLAVAVQVDDVAHHASGPIIFLGSTILSNSSADTYPPPTASCRRVVPFLCAVLAILAALS